MSNQSVVSSPLISAQSIDKSFKLRDRKLAVLKSLDLKIEAGGSVCLLGKSGSGKSTLLSLIAGLDQIDGGELFVAGANLSQMTEKELTVFRSQNIGIIFQHFHLLTHLSALENVMLSLEITQSQLGRSEIKEKSLQMLKRVGLSDRVDHLPAMLSGGEKQRVAIARALVSSPKILLADEPSGSLDQQTGQEVMDLIFSLVQERKTTFILVTHDQALAQRCDQVYTLDAGSIKL